MFDVGRMAKEQKQPEQVLPPEAGPEMVGPPKSYRLQILLAFVSLILFQMIILWLLLPTPPPRPQLGIGPGDEGNGFDAPRLLEVTDLTNREPMVERSLNEGRLIKIKSPQGEVQETFSVSVALKIRKVDAGKFDKRYSDCTSEILDCVRSILFASTEKERKEANLASIKEKMKREINFVLGAPWVQAVLCPESSFEQQ